MNEHDIQSQMISYCRSIGLLAFQTDVMSGLQFFSHKDRRRFSFINHHKKMGYINGQPDIVIVAKDKCLFVEVKTPTTYKMGKRGKEVIDKKGGVQSEDQKLFQQIATELGHDYYLVDNIDDFIKIVSKYT